MLSDNSKQLHQGLGATFLEVNGVEMVGDYGAGDAEHTALWESVGVVDLSGRGRLCLTGTDRQKFLNGQVTNNVKDLKPGEGCYAALINAKGRMQSDLQIYMLANEILLDFEPGLTAGISERLEKYVIAEDVQLIDVGQLYGLFSVQGPVSDRVLEKIGFEPPAKPFAISWRTNSSLGEVYLANRPRCGTKGFDLFVPIQAVTDAVERLRSAASDAGGCFCGWKALETARIEAGVPRFGIDMDDTNLAPETGLEATAISYSKGCYIGQEVIARIRTYGQVTKSLRGLRLSSDMKELPEKGARLFHHEKDAGYITSVLASPKFKANIALGYVRREVNEPGTRLILHLPHGDALAEVLDLPFAKNFS